MEAYAKNPEDAEPNIRLCSSVHAFETPTTFRNLSIPVQLSTTGDEEKQVEMEERKQATIKWKLLLYPAGNPSSEPSSLKSHVSVFLARNSNLPF